VPVHGQVPSAFRFHTLLTPNAPLRPRDCPLRHYSITTRPCHSDGFLAMAEPVCTQARDQLARLAFPRSGIHEPNLRFYPRSDLRRAFTSDAINSILSCLCARCTRHLSYIGQSHLADPAVRERPSDFTERVLGRNSAHSAIALFALLVHCGYPIFIIRFLERGYDDASTIESYCKQERNKSAHDLEATHWREFQIRDGFLSRQLADAFIGAMHQFAPPLMEDRDHAVYGSRRIMPFFAEELLGRGTFGDVYGFKVHHDYLRIPVGPCFRLSRLCLRSLH
jgi:hypothetical protein